MERRKFRTLMINSEGVRTHKSNKIRIELSLMTYRTPFVMMSFRGDS
jgi:hypothetical protein